uniref:Putative secreted protein n=1 Tax=Anopheles darlingi TaxID=43151 RepID=A0A2M4DH43_ANODA
MRPSSFFILIPPSLPAPSVAIFASSLSRRKPCWAGRLSRSPTLAIVIGTHATRDTPHNDVHYRNTTTTSTHGFKTSGKIHTR